MHSRSAIERDQILLVRMRRSLEDYSHKLANFQSTAPPHPKKKEKKPPLTFQPPQPQIPQPILGQHAPNRPPQHLPPAPLRHQPFHRHGP